MVTWSFNSNLLSCLLHQPSNLKHANTVANLNLCTLQNSLCMKQHEKQGTLWSSEVPKVKNPAENQNNLLKGIVNLLGAARSVVYICKTALDHSFSNIYSLFWLECWPYILKLKSGAAHTAEQAKTTITPALYFSKSS